VSLLRQSVAGLSPLRPGFNPRSVHVRFVLEEVTLEEVILLGISFFPVSIIPPMFRLLLYLHVTRNRTTNGTDLELSKQAITFGNTVAVYGKVLSLSFIKERGRPPT